MNNKFKLFQIISNYLFIFDVSQLQENVDEFKELFKNIFLIAEKKGLKETLDLINEHLEHQEQEEEATL